MSHWNVSPSKRFAVIWAVSEPVRSTSKRTLTAMATSTSFTPRQTCAPPCTPSTSQTACRWRRSAARLFQPSRQQLRVWPAWSALNWSRLLRATGPSPTSGICSWTWACRFFCSLSLARVRGQRWPRAATLLCGISGRYAAVPRFFSRTLLPLSSHNSNWRFQVTKQVLINHRIRTILGFDSKFDQLVFQKKLF